MKGVFTAIGIIVVLFIVLAISGVLNVAGWFINDPQNGAVVVAQEQFNARELLRKYTWFKETRAALDQKIATLKVYESKNAKFEKLEADGKLDRINREQLMTWQQEQAGIAASYNELASEYNAKHAEIHWAFTDVGRLPKGETQTLPRDYAPYLTK